MKPAYLVNTYMHPKGDSKCSVLDQEFGKDCLTYDTSFGYHLREDAEYYTCELAVLQLTLAVKQLHLRENYMLGPTPGSICESGCQARTIKFVSTQWANLVKKHRTDTVRSVIQSYKNVLQLVYKTHGV
jgi:hypothetical protein